MKLDPQTLAILENFGTINQGIVIKPGSRLRTYAVLENIFAACDVPNEFPREFAVYDLNELLATLSLLKDPDLEFKNDHILITSGGTRVKYFYSSPAVVVVPPANDISLNDPMATLVLKSEDIKRIQKSAAALKLKELQFCSDSIKAFNSNAVGNQISIDVEVDGDISSPKVIKIDNLKMIDGDYDVTVYGPAIKFQSRTIPSLFYFVTVESDK